MAIYTVIVHADINNRAGSNPRAKIYNYQVVADDLETAQIRAKNELDFVFDERGENTLSYTMQINPPN